MNATEDFTTIPAGTEVLLEGLVRPCPMCGRNAIEHRQKDRAPYWVHRQKTEILGDGLRVDFDDLCDAGVPIQ